MTYKEARVYLDEMSKYGSVLGLDTIRDLLEELGNPQDDLKFIHIAGTNGKGSVLAYTSTILSEAGYRTGRYISPTVVSYLERIQVNGVWISEEEFAELTQIVKDAIARLKAEGKPEPTVFETETAIAFLYFRKCSCDLVVLEAGLGGARDATNIVKNTVCAAFASISRDHIGVLGDTVGEIAEDKAGIIKPGCAVVSSGQTEYVEEILRRRAGEAGVPFYAAKADPARTVTDTFKGLDFSYGDFPEVHTVMGGVNQLENAVTALEIIRVLRRKGYEIPDEAVIRGMGKTEWPGRFTCLGENPVFIADGAHNEAAALRLRESVEKYFPGRRLILIMGVFRDKEYGRMTEILCSVASAVYTVDLPDEGRGLPAEKLAEAARSYCSAVYVPRGKTDRGKLRKNEEEYGKYQAEGVRRAVSDALDSAGENDVILACGSLSWMRQAKEAYDRKKGAKNDKS